jgi:hypothetical protein
MLDILALVIAAFCGGVWVKSSRDTPFRRLYLTSAAALVAYFTIILAVSL